MREREDRKGTLVTIMLLWEGTFYLCNTHTLKNPAMFSLNTFTVSGHEPLEGEKVVMAIY